MTVGLLTVIGFSFAMTGVAALERLPVMASLGPLPPPSVQGGSAAQDPGEPASAGVALPALAPVPAAPVDPVGPALAPDEFLTAPAAAPAVVAPKARPTEPPISARELHGRVSPAVVALVVSGGAAPPAVATGTLVTASGLVLTSRSAIAAAVDGGATLAVVRGSGGGRLPPRALNEAVPARVVASCDELDLAVVEAMPRSSVFYPHLPITRRAVAEAAPLLAVGHGSKRGLWAGTLTSLGATKGRAGAARWLRVLAGEATALEPGTPLVDAIGRIVALTVAAPGDGGRAAVDASGLLRFLLSAGAPNLRFAGVSPVRRPVPGLALAAGGSDADGGGAAPTREAGDAAMPEVTRKGILDRRFQKPATQPTAKTTAAPAGAARGPAEIAFWTAGSVRVTLADLERHPAAETLRLEIGDAPARGAAAAPVTIVQLGDFHSPETRQVEATLRALVEGDAAPARLFWKDSDRGDGSDYHLPARAARAAGEQDEFWSMHDRLLRGAAEPSVDKVRKLARELRLDEQQFAASLQSPGSSGAVELDAQRAGKVPVLCTPAFVVNGQVVEGGSIAGPALLAAVDDEVVTVLAKRSPPRTGDAVLAPGETTAPKGQRTPRAIAPGAPISGATFDAAKMARVVADATKRASKR